jgi:hypothetical protein
MTLVPRSRRGAWLALAAVAMLPACGSDSAPTPPSTTPPTTLPPVTQAVVASGSGALPALNAAGIAFNTSTSGRLDATVEWTFASNDVDVYLVRGACSFEEFVNLLCNIVSFSESTTAKPERISFQGAPPDAYVLVIANYGPADESVAFQVVLTSGPGVSSAPVRSAAPRAGAGRPPVRPRRGLEDAGRWGK